MVRRFLDTVHGFNQKNKLRINTTFGLLRSLEGLQPLLFWLEKNTTPFKVCCVFSSPRSLSVTGSSPHQR